FDLWRMLRDTVGFNRLDIEDWQPITRVPLGMLATWLFVAGSAIVLTARTRSAVTAPVVLICSALAFASFRVSRITPFLAEAVALLLAAPLERASAGAARRPSTTPPESRAAIALVSAGALGAIGAAIALSVGPMRCIRLDPSSPEPDVAAFVRQHITHGRM